MPRETRFWRNVTLIGLAHVALLMGLVRWGGALKKPIKTNIVWMAAPAGGASAADPTPEPITEEPPPAEEQSASPTPEEHPTPEVTPAESEIPLPSPTPTPTPTPSSTPQSTPRPKPTEKPTPKSKSTKRKPKSTPKPTPKKTKEKKPKPSATPKKEPTAAKKEKASVAVDPLAKGGESGSMEDRRGAAARAAEANAYGNMLHDRFFGAWVQPKTAAATGSKMAALVQIRIERDGRVSEFKIARSSGNVVVDESITAVGRRVLKVDPLPAGLEAGGYYDVRIRFELDIE
ncbi:MAG: energy transducer TonB [Chthoniobacterales bacterium]